MSLLAVLEGSAFCAGIAMGTASVLSVGPNTVTLIREGLAGGRVSLVATLVWGSRLVLLGTALLLTDTIATKGAALRPVLSWLGFGVLCWFALSSLRAYLFAHRTLRLRGAGRETTAQCVRRILTLVWLNPLTYVEMLFVPATVGASFMMPVCRLLFIAGLVIMATASCYGYAFGGRACAPLFRRPDALRMFDLSSGVLLSVLAAVLAVGLCLRPPG